MAKIEVIEIPLANIKADPEWNSRSGDHKAQEVETGESGQTFSDLVASIKAKGLDRPVEVMPLDPKKPDSGKYFLISGFRRYSATTQIAEETQNKNPTIMAIVRNVSMAEARRINLAENIQSNVKASDMAWGLLALEDEYKKAGQPTTAEGLAAEVGKHQTHVSLLLRIMHEVKSAITKQWRNLPLQIGLREMAALAKLDKAEQDAAWKTLLDRKQSVEKSDPRKAKVENLKKRAEKVGELIGTLERVGYIETHFEFDSESIAVLVDLPEGLTKKQVESIVKACENGYERGTEEPEAEEPEAEEDAAE